MPSEHILKLIETRDISELFRSVAKDSVPAPYNQGGLHTVPYDSSQIESLWMEALEEINKVNALSPTELEERARAYTAERNEELNKKRVEDEATQWYLRKVKEIVTDWECPTELAALKSTVLGVLSVELNNGGCYSYDPFPPISGKEWKSNFISNKLKYVTRLQKEQQKEELKASVINAWIKTLEEQLNEVCWDRIEADAARGAKRDDLDSHGASD